MTVCIDIPSTIGDIQEYLVILYISKINMFVGDIRVYVVRPKIVFTNYRSLIYYSLLFNFMGGSIRYAGGVMCRIWKQICTWLDLNS